MSTASQRADLSRRWLFLPTRMTRSRAHASAAGAARLSVRSRSKYQRRWRISRRSWECNTYTKKENGCSIRTAPAPGCGWPGLFLNKKFCRLILKYILLCHTQFLKLRQSYQRLLTLINHFLQLMLQQHEAGMGFHKQQKKKQMVNPHYSWLR